MNSRYSINFFGFPSLSRKLQGKLQYDFPMHQTDEICHQKRILKLIVGVRLFEGNLFNDSKKKKRTYYSKTNIYISRYAQNWILLFFFFIFAQAESPIINAM